MGEILLCANSESVWTAGHTRIVHFMYMVHPSVRHRLAWWSFSPDNAGSSLFLPDRACRLLYHIVSLLYLPVGLCILHLLCRVYSLVHQTLEKSQQLSVCMRIVRSQNAVERNLSALRRTQRIKTAHQSLWQFPDRQTNIEMDSAKTEKFSAENLVISNKTSTFALAIRKW